MPAHVYSTHGVSLHDNKHTHTRSACNALTHSSIDPRAHGCLGNVLTTHLSMKSRANIVTSRKHRADIEKTPRSCIHSIDA
mmetsp:Transcript_42487/g.120554  ORF Transcript_42487/g.120554 Transcript_42487/m.120554 type:complete len:81 (+) Transcript_42487:496-738(+)